MKFLLVLLFALGSFASDDITPTAATCNVVENAITSADADDTLCTGAGTELTDNTATLACNDVNDHSELGVCTDDDKRKYCCPNVCSEFDGCQTGTKPHPKYKHRHEVECIGVCDTSQCECVDVTCTARKPDETSDACADTFGQGCSCVNSEVCDCPAYTCSTGGGATDCKTCVSLKDRQAVDHCSECNDGSAFDGVNLTCKRVEVTETATLD